MAQPNWKFDLFGFLPVIGISQVAHKFQKTQWHYYDCFPLLILRSEMFPSRRRYHLIAICSRDTYGSHLELTWLSPKNIVYYCPGCSKSLTSVGSVKNLPSYSGTHSKGLNGITFLHLMSKIVIRSKT